MVTIRTVARKNIHSRRSSLPPHSVSKSVIVIALAFVITFAFAHNPFSLPRKTNVSGCSHARRRSSRATERPSGEIPTVCRKMHFISLRSRRPRPRCVRPRVRPLLSHPSRRRRRRPQCHVRAARIPMAREAGAWFRDSARRGPRNSPWRPRGTAGGGQNTISRASGKDYDLCYAASERARERAASNRMNSCRPSNEVGRNTI